MISSGRCACWRLRRDAGEVAVPTSIGVCLELVVRRMLATTCCGQVMWLSSRHHHICWPLVAVPRCCVPAAILSCATTCLALEVAGSSCIDPRCAVSVGWQRRAVLRLWVSAASLCWDAPLQPLCPALVSSVMARFA